MSILRKISFFTASIMLLLSVLPCVSHAQPAAQTSDNSIEVDFAKGLGIITEYDGDRNITIGDVANAVNILTDNTNTAEKYFRDYKYDSEAVYSDIISTYVDIAGYTQYSEYKYGDTSWNSICAAARDMGLITNDLKNKRDKATAENLVNISYRLLNVKLKKETYFADGGTTLKSSDEPYMNYVLDMYTVTDIVEATGWSSLRPGAETEDNSVIIGGARYKCDKNAFEDMVGRRVTALVRDKSGEKPKVIAMHDEGKTLELAADDIASGSATRTGLTYYNKNKKKVKVSFDSAADVLYNYSAYPGFEPKELEVRQGQLVLIDNDRDGKYEVIKIEEYEAIKVFSVSVSSKKISDVYGNAYSIEDMIENDYPIYQNGKLIDASNIPTEKIAALFKNKDGEIVRMFITDESAAGFLEAIDKAENKATIDGVEYTYTFQIEKDFELNKPRDLLTLYFDKYGAIAYFELSSDSYRYGYLIDFMQGTGVSPAKVKIFTDQSEFEIYEARSKIRINGVQMSSNAAFDENNYSSGLCDEVGKISQLVKYKINGEKELTELLTPTNSDAGDTGRPRKMKDGVYKYYSNPKTICADTRMNMATRVFLIPEDLSYTKRFKYGGSDLLSNDTSYTCQVYDIDGDRYAGVVVARTGNYGITTIDDVGGAVYLITSTSLTLNDEEKETICLELMKTDGTTMKYKLADKDINIKIGNGKVASYLTPKDLKEGDIIQMASDHVNTMEINNIIVWYSDGNTEPYEVVKSRYYAAKSETTFISDGWTFAYGTVKDMIDCGMMINNQEDPALDSWDRVVTFKATTPVYLIDDSPGKILKTTTADIVPGDRIFSLLKAGAPTALYVYRN